MILSGTASDGAIGLADVKRAGGITFAQSPESAKYDGMPRAAIDTGMVDLVLSPAAIGAKLAELGIRGRVPATTFADDHDVAPDNLQRIYDVLQAGQRRRLPALQAADDQAAAVPADGAAPDQRRR